MSNFWGKLFGVARQPANDAHPEKHAVSKIRCGHLSITGNYRENNEDSYVVDPQSRFFIVADGMGGQSAGERASAMAIELVPQRLVDKLNFQNDEAEKVVMVIDDAIRQTNQEIMSLGESDPKYHNMGTTIAFLVNVGGRYFIGNVGDSRVYRLRDGQLTQLTTDHSLTQALVDAGTITAEEAVHHRYKNVLYRYLGTKDGSNTGNSREMDVFAGDVYMICSDGVTDGAAPDVIRQVLIDQPDPQAASEQIIRAAQDGGSKDNITCVVLVIDG